MRCPTLRSALLGLAGAWIVAAGAYSYPEVRDDLEGVFRFRQLAAERPPVIPSRCFDGRGSISHAVVCREGASQCWMELSRFQQLYPEVAAVTDEDASERIVLAGGHVLENRVDSLRDALLNAVTLALSPLCIVALGLLPWRYRGVLARYGRGWLG
jgi:hypothetical protein